MVRNNLFKVLSERLTNPDTVEMIKRTLAQGVVLDTWINGEQEEYFDEGAQIALITVTERWTSEAVRTKAIFRNFLMPEEYVRYCFHEILSSTALYAAQKKKGRREVTLQEVDEAVDRLSRFIAHEPRKLTVAGDFFFIVSAHEDLSAIAYYGRIKEDDFIQGRLHRPWSSMALSASLILYQQLDLIETFYTGDGDMLYLTQHGTSTLTQLRCILSSAGEFNWRSENQRWVIFGEMDYDKVFSRIMPENSQKIKEYLERIGIQSGMRILEVGAGTGRVTVDLGLCDLVGPKGSVVALDPNATLLQKLANKCRERDIKNVEVVQGVAEKLPFPDNNFDAAVSVYCLHFTDAPTAVAEMVRVTKSGGFVSAFSAPPEFDLRKIPMVALWFRPLTKIANSLGVLFGENNGLPIGLLEETFRTYLDEVEVWDVPHIVSASDYRSFLNFVIKGGAFFQNILCRLPYQERWNIIRRLEQDGARIEAETSEQEKANIFINEAAYGRVPAAKLSLMRT